MQLYQFIYKTSDIYHKLSKKNNKHTKKLCYSKRKKTQTHQNLNHLVPIKKGGKKALKCNIQTIKSK